MEPECRCGPRHARVGDRPRLAPTITKIGQGTLTFASTATSLVAGTVVNINGGQVAVTNATGFGRLGHDQHEQRIYRHPGSRRGRGDLRARSSGYAFNSFLNIGAVNPTFSAINGAGGVILAAGQTVTIGNAGNLNSAFYGAISSAAVYAATTGAVTKSGTGTLTLGGINYQSGLFTINAGTVQGLDNANVLGTGAITFANSGTTLDLRANGSPTFGFGAITLPSTGNATINVQQNQLMTGAGFLGNGSGGYNVFSAASSPNISGTGAQSLTITGDTNYGLKLTAFRRLPPAPRPPSASIPG